jgi:lipopolysaccharide transport system ATP-binding protein
MLDTVIQVENLGKKYVLGQHKGVRYKTLREAINTSVKSFSQRFLTPFADRNTNLNTEQFWALKDVSFEVKQGDLVGIIGRNGAGKSTLLKILSRITEPTTGRIGIKGRVASLLEVGTGFHPELTGRENIYLNGAILGMSRTEIRRKFDEIVAFAEVEKFLDTPVKFYSSGMYVRLAFAVAAHLEPEILVIDEVLAVGDAEFQKKCLGKMDMVGKEGRTVLFVSHNMAAVEKLCQRAVVLHQGTVRYIGSQTEGITHYITSFSPNLVSLRNRNDREGSGEVRVVAIEIRDEQGNILEAVQSGQTIEIYLYFEVYADVKLTKIVAGLLISTQLDFPVFLQHNRLTQDNFGVLPNKGAFVCKIQSLPLAPSIYKIMYSVMPNYGLDETYIDALEDAMELIVVEGDFYGSGEIPKSIHGVCLVKANWRLEPGKENVNSSQDFTKKAE